MKNGNNNVFFWAWGMQKSLLLTSAAIYVMLGSLVAILDNGNYVRIICTLHNAV